ncbi:hypothetical protein AB0869_20995 [Micromonospora vinacea]|uniref:hypothetical protein n=1 Tax=Micromonospora vinacea TaxID=709878 RepID=UPI0034550181
MSVDDPRDPPAGAVAALLRDLLTIDPRYRQLWRERAGRDHGRLNQAAVARVVELHLWDTGEREESSTALARQLKDRISRAISGVAISHQTLHWIIEAFGMDEEDRRRLWELFSGKNTSSGGIYNTLRQRRELIRRQRHRTVSLAERYSVGSQGVLLERRTLHTIRATEDGISSYIFNHEPEASQIDVVHGGRLGESFEYGGGLRSVEISLDRPLAKAETTALEYCTYFEAVRRLEVRRAAFARTENVDLAVEFKAAEPKAAWWCVWDDHIEGAPIKESRILLNRGSIRKYIPYIEETVVGFRWEW